MLIHSTLKGGPRQPLKPTSSPSGRTESAPAPRDTFLRSVGASTWKVAKKVGKVLKPYARSAMIAAAPALATAVAASVGGFPAAGVALLAGTGVGMVAGGATWGKDIGLLRGMAAGGIAGMFSSALGGIGGALGVTYMATVGATREAILRHLA